MKKVIAVMIVAMFLGVSVASICSSEKIDGEIKARAENWIGLVCPEICIDNITSVTFKVNITEGEDETTYIVEDVLSIPLNVTVGEKVKDILVFPRSIFYSVIMQRPFSMDLLKPTIRGFLKRMFPVIQLVKSVNVVDGMLGKAQSYLNITLDYSISNETYLNPNGENLTMHIFVMGFLPGEVNGIDESIPIVAHKTVTLEVTYEELV
jgi:hypothetical protein